jgi:hypothetical protein
MPCTVCRVLSPRVQPTLRSVSTAVLLLDLDDCISDSCCAEKSCNPSFASDASIVSGTREALIGACQAGPGEDRGLGPEGPGTPHPMKPTVPLPIRAWHAWQGIFQSDEQHLLIQGDTTRGPPVRRCVTRIGTCRQHLHLLGYRREKHQHF